MFVIDGAYELAVSYYVSAIGQKPRSAQDEKLLCQKIHTRLANQSAKDAEKFDESYAKLKNSVSTSE